MSDASCEVGNCLQAFVQQIETDTPSSSALAVLTEASSIDEPLQGAAEQIENTCRPTFAHPGCLCFPPVVRLPAVLSSQDLSQCAAEQIWKC